VRLRVYGRTKYAEPLMELGTAENGAELLAQFPGEWVELVAFPEGAIHWIIRDGLEVDPE
jgi:hypothetical protein